MVSLTPEQQDRLTVLIVRSKVAGWPDHMNSWAGWAQAGFDISLAEGEARLSLWKQALDVETL